MDNKIEILRSICFTVEDIDTIKNLDDLGDFSDKDIEFMIDKIKVSVSSGFYVRQFVSDLAHKLKVSGVTFSINRTKVGDYTL